MSHLNQTREGDEATPEMGDTQNSCHLDEREEQSRAGLTVPHRNDIGSSASPASRASRLLQKQKLIQDMRIARKASESLPNLAIPAAQATPNQLLSLRDLVQDRLQPSSLLAELSETSRQTDKVRLAANTTPTAHSATGSNQQCQTPTRRPQREITKIERFYRHPQVQNTSFRLGRQRSANRKNVTDANVGAQQQVTGAHRDTNEDDPQGDAGSNTFFRHACTVPLYLLWAVAFVLRLRYVRWAILLLVISSVILIAALSIWDLGPKCLVLWLGHFAGSFVPHAGFLSGPYGQRCVNPGRTSYASPGQTDSAGNLWNIEVPPAVSLTFPKFGTGIEVTSRRVAAVLQSDENLSLYARESDRPETRPMILLDGEIGIFFRQLEAEQQQYLSLLRGIKLSPALFREQGLRRLGRHWPLCLLVPSESKDVILRRVDRALLLLEAAVTSRKRILPSLGEPFLERITGKSIKITRLWKERLVEEPGVVAHYVDKRLLSSSPATSDPGRARLALEDDLESRQREHQRLFRGEIARAHVLYAGTELAEESWKRLGKVIDKDHITLKEHRKAVESLRSEIMAANMCEVQDAGEWERRLVEILVDILIDLGRNYRQYRSSPGREQRGGRWD